MQAVILAAGRGKRLQPLTLTRSKAMMPVWGKPMLARVLDSLSHSDLGEFIRQQRERANLSLRRLADKAGMSNPYLSQIERGLRKPSGEILKAIARGLYVPVEALYERAGLLDDRERQPVAAAIEADIVLTTKQKQALMEIYQSFVGDDNKEN